MAHRGYRDNDWGASHIERSHLVPGTWTEHDSVRNGISPLSPERARLGHIGVTLELARKNGSVNASMASETLIGT